MTVKEGITFGEQNVPDPVYLPVTPSEDEGLVAGFTMLPHVQRFVDDVAVATSEHSFGTYIGHDPTVDRAVDMFTPLDSRTLGDAICNFAIDHMDTYGIWYIIYRQHIYNPEIGKYWRLMEDRGSPTQNHMDHVHASFYATVTNPPPPPPPATTIQEDDLRIINVHNTGIFLIDGTRNATHITQPSDVEELVKVGIPYDDQKEMSQTVFLNYFVPNQ